MIYNNKIINKDIRIYKQELKYLYNFNIYYINFYNKKRYLFEN